MKYKTHLAALFLSATLMGVTGLSGSAYAHEEGDFSALHCEHKDFSDVQRTLLHDTLRQLHESDKASFKQIHELHEGLHSVLVAKTFDAGAFLALTSQIEEKHAQLEKERLQAFALIADKFAPEERERLVQIFGHRQGGEHQGEWHRHDGQKEGLNNDAQTIPNKD